MKKEATVSSLPKAIQAGLRKAMANEKPFLLFPVNWLAGKAVGKQAVDDFYWKFLQKPILDADIALGRGAQYLSDKVTRKSGKLFKDTKLLEMGRGKGLETGKKEYLLPSITAPVNKAGKLVIPTLGAIKLEEMIRGKDMSENNQINQADLQKTASMLKELNEKRAHFEKRAKATELLYKQAELGQIKFPQTFDDYQEKVAELLSKDLDVVEEAIKMASATDENSFGGHLEKQAKVLNARDNFAMSIVEN